MTTRHRLLPGSTARAGLVALALLLAVIPLAGSASAATTTRLQAVDNVSAALAWSTATFANGTASTAILARDNLFADSLASGAAQSAVGAPLLLTNGNTLDPRVLAELARLDTDEVLILGGSAAISDAVVAQLNAAQFTTERLSGETRIETAIAITQRLYPSATNAVIARAFAADEPTQAFADSLATAAFSAATNSPVLFTETARLTGSTRAYLESSTIRTITIAGGNGAVSDGVVAELEALDIVVTRESGPNRFATAVAMSATRGFASAARAERVILVEGTTADAWASGFAAAMQSAGSGAPLVLSARDTLPSETSAFLADGNGRIALLCGPYVTTAACDAAEAALR